MSQFNAGDKYVIAKPFDSNSTVVLGYGPNYVNGTPVTVVGKPPRNEVFGPGGHIRVRAEGLDPIWVVPSHLQPAE